MTHSPAQIADPSPGKICPECGYDLRGITSQQCPECGLNVNDPNYSSIPWANRARIGRFKAFWKTALMATFRPKRFAKAVAQLVDFHAANRFRWIVVVLATLPAVAFVVAVECLDKNAGWRMMGRQNLFGDLQGREPGLVWDVMVIYEAGFFLVPTFPLIALILLALWTASPGIWFRPRRLSVLEQNRAIAMSRYACAPLAWLPLVGLGVVPLAVGGAINSRVLDDSGALVGTIIVVVLILSLFILFTNWWSCLELLSTSSRCGRARRICAALGIPAIWIVCSWATIMVVSAIVGFVSIVIDSFR